VKGLLVSCRSVFESAGCPSMWPAAGGGGACIERSGHLLMDGRRMLSASWPVGSPNSRLAACLRGEAARLLTEHDQGDETRVGITRVRRVLSTET
jgi:hypothetical protein